MLKEAGRAPHTDFWLWCYRSGHGPPIILFEYTETCVGKHPQRYHGPPAACRRPLVQGDDSDLGRVPATTRPLTERVLNGGGSREPAPVLGIGTGPAVETLPDLAQTIGFAQTGAQLYRF